MIGFGFASSVEPVSWPVIAVLTQKKSTSTRWLLNKQCCGRFIAVPSTMCGDLLIGIFTEYRVCGIDESNTGTLCVCSFLRLSDDHDVELEVHEG